MRKAQEKIQWRSYPQSLELIGQTPIIELSARLKAMLGNESLQLLNQGQLLVKLEGQNLTGSVKDKNAQFFLDFAKERGLLRPGMPIVESSSGNFGLSLALIGGMRGHPVYIVIDPKTSHTFQHLLKLYGAKLVMIDISKIKDKTSYQRLRMERALELSKKMNAYYPCQHLMPLSGMAHSLTTAKEIESQTQGEIDAIFVGVSTASQIMGIARYIRRKFPHIKIFGVDVQGSAVFGGKAQSYKMTGVGLSFKPPHLNLKMLSGHCLVEESISYSFLRSLLKSEGLFLGASSGAVICAGLRYALEKPKSRILMISADRGDRYLDTLYSNEWMFENGFPIYNHKTLWERIKSLSINHYPKVQLECIRTAEN